MATYTGQDKRLLYLFQNGGGGGGGSANIWTGTRAEYIAQASQIANDTAVFITDDEIQSLVVSSYEIYSMTEKEIGVWVDGKPLYQVTLMTASLIDMTANTWYKTEFSRGDIDLITGGFFVIEGQTPSEHNAFSFGFIDGKIAINSPRAYQMPVGTRFTIKYTKTTDVAGAGLFVPSGIMAVHYSTTEQIIGTWLGETLYQKVVATGGSEPSGATLIYREARTGYDVIEYTKTP